MNRLALLMAYACLVLSCAFAWAGDRAASEDADSVSTAKRLVEAINQRDSQPWLEAICVDGYMSRVLRGVTLPTNSRTRFRLGLAMNIPKLAQGIVEPLVGTQSRAKWLKSVSSEHASSAQLIRLDRIDGDGNFQSTSYLRLEFDAAACLIDMFDYTSAQHVTALPRRIMLTGLEAGAPGNELGINKDTSEIIRVVVRAARESRYDDAWHAFEQLPEAVRSLRETMLWQLALSPPDVAPERRAKILASIAKRYGSDPELAFLLIDHYLPRGDYAWSMQALENFEQKVSRDGVTRFMQCLMEFEQERFHQAREACEEGRALEPDLVQNWNLLASIYRELDQAKAAVEMLDDYEQQFDLELDPSALMKLEDYAWLKHHHEYKVWAKAQR